VVKLNELMANCSIYSTALDITDAANALAVEGNLVDHDDLATITPYITHTIRRLGDLVRRPRPTRRGADHPPGSGTPCPVPRRPRRLTSRSGRISVPRRRLRRLSSYAQRHVRMPGPGSGGRGGSATARPWSWMVDASRPCR
jgi:Tn3 transposase DDE domain